MSLQSTILCDPVTLELNACQHGSHGEQPEGESTSITLRGRGNIYSWIWYQPGCWASVLDVWLFQNLNYVLSVSYANSM